MLIALKWEEKELHKTKPSAMLEVTKPNKQKRTVCQPMKYSYGYF